MAIDVQDQKQREKLQESIKYAYERNGTARERRNQLIRIHNDDDDMMSVYLPESTNRQMGTFVNYFQSFVRGQLLSLSNQAPRWSVTSRTTDGRGFDRRIESFLTRYFEVLDFDMLIRLLAMDTAFGDCVVKIVDGVAPRGVTSPYAPRVYRVNPNDLIVDASAESFMTAGFIADMYLVPLSEANAYFQTELRPFNLDSADSRSTYNNHNQAFPEAMTRLIDVYTPSKGTISTFPCENDSFSGIEQEPLMVKRTPINPYEVCKLVLRPDSVEELSRLWFLKEQHFLANDMWHKMARQARQSRRNPVDRIGNESDLSSIQTTPDGEAVFLNDLSTLDLYTLPGPEASVAQVGSLAAQMFSEQAGNLEVALGNNPGAPTARQTQAILGQISAVQAYDRGIFERFLRNIGKKVATMAFQSEVLQLNVMQEVPGTPLRYNYGWAPARYLPRVGTIHDYQFEVVPYSTAFREPMERVQQLNEASQQILQWMVALAQGAPIDLASVIKSYEKAYDLSDLIGWWSGKKPTPTESTANTYSSTAAPPQGSNVNYNGAGGVDAGLPAFEGAQGGLARA